MLRTTSFLSLFASAALLGAAEVSKIMPQSEDYTSMWWKDGFPTVVDGAPWLRCIQTGHYSMILDTEALKITHLGPVPAGSNYEGFVKSTPWQAVNLTPADLKLEMTVNGKSYRCTKGGAFSRFEGPRLVESGRFFQKGDVTDLVFTAEDGAVLNAKTRFETSAWPERLGLILAATPGVQELAGGESSFGVAEGGFGFDGKTFLEVPHEAALDTEHFTMGLWVFVPHQFAHHQGAAPWLVCKNYHEEHNGNYGITLHGGKPVARLNIGGGKDNAFAAWSGQSVNFNQWNHIAMSYDGNVLRLFLNGKNVSELPIGRVRTLGSHPLVFGRRADTLGSIFLFRGVMDEIEYFNSALDPKQIETMGAKVRQEIPGVQSVKTWSFKADGVASKVLPTEKWHSVSMGVQLSAGDGKPSLAKTWSLPQGEVWGDGEWKQVGLAIHPARLQEAAETSPIQINVLEKVTGGERPVSFDYAEGNHRIDLNGVQQELPSNGDKNSSIERYKVVIANPTDHPQVAALKFVKDKHPPGITGVSMMLRDAEGNPTGIPVQISKNWHIHQERERTIYDGAWFHGLTHLRLPPGSSTELELVISFAHWGGVAATSHVQLSLVGWGSNQHWSQSALGSWGETICYEPEQVQANATVTDVRPLMIKGSSSNKWGWTSNVGGADFFRFFDPAGKRIGHSAMQTAYLKHGPCLSEVVFSGRIGEGIRHSTTVNLARTDDIVRGVYRLRMDVDKAMDFSRMVFFQVGADTYNFTKEKKMAVGNAEGLKKEWNTQGGGFVYRTEPIELSGSAPWISLHEGEPRFPTDAFGGVWANRGIVVRSWKARLGGKDASAWMAEFGVKRHNDESSTADIVPPPGLNRLEPGDFIEATFSHIVMPQFAENYYGPNEVLRAELAKNGNTWRMIQHEAAGNILEVNVSQGAVERTYPDVRVTASKDAAEFSVKGGLAYIPVTFTGLSSSAGYALYIDGKLLDQSTHGKDYWQTDYDSVSKTWSRTYNVPAAAGKSQLISLKLAP